MGDHESEGSGTAKVGTDEQNLGAADLTTEGSKLHTEAGYGGQGNTTKKKMEPKSEIENGRDGSDYTGRVERLVV